MATLPHVLGPYQLGEPLAKPGLGQARAAVHASNGAPALAVTIPTTRQRDHACERLYTDGWLDCRLTGIDGLVGLHHAELLPGPGRGEWRYAAVVDSYQPQHTIAHFIDRRGPLGPLNALRLLKLVARALVALEQRRMHHGYLHPEQVVLDPQGRPRLTHPVVARAERSLAGSDRVPHGFVAPEVLAGGPGSIASDCYAAGALLHFVATGRAPVAGLDMGEFHPELLSQIEVDPAQGHQGLDPTVAGLVRRAMAVHPAERFVTAIDLLHAVERAQKAVAETREGFDAVEEEGVGGTSAWSRPVGSGRISHRSGIRRRRSSSEVDSRPTGRARSTESRSGSGSGIRPTRRHVRPSSSQRLAPVCEQPRRQGHPALALVLIIIAALGIVIGLLQLQAWLSP
jgi:hypothetical protein